MSHTSSARSRLVCQALPGACQDAPPEGVARLGGFERRRKGGDRVGDGSHGSARSSRATSARWQLGQPLGTVGENETRKQVGERGLLSHGSSLDTTRHSTGWLPDWGSARPEMFRQPGAAVPSRCSFPSSLEPVAWGTWCTLPSSPSTSSGTPSWTRLFAACATACAFPSADTERGCFFWRSNGSEAPVATKSCLTANGVRWPARWGA